MIKMMLVFASTYLSLALPYVLYYPYMGSMGYSASQQGLIMTAGSLLGVFAQMVFGFLCDRFKSIKRFVAIGNVIMIISVWFFYTQTSATFLLYIFFGAIYNALFQNIEGMLDSWALEVDETCKQNYGIIRAFGAIGWIGGSSLVAWIVGVWNYNAIGYWFVGTAVINMILEVITPDADKSQVKDTEKLQLSDVGKLLGNKRYVLIVFLLFLSFAMLVGEIFCSAQKMNALGLDTAANYASIKASVQAICELPLFFLGGFLIKKFGANKLMVFALFVHVIRMVLTAFAVTQMQLVLISALQLFTYPCMMVSIKVLVDNETPAELKSSGQQFAYAIYLSFAALIVPMLFGYLIDIVGLAAEVWITGGITLIPLIALLIYGKRTV